MGNKVEKEKKEKKKTNKYEIYLIMILIIIFLIAILILLLLRGGFARYTGSFSGSASAEVAKPICILEVVDTGTDDELNTYCDVTVKNFNSDNEISEVGMDYAITVTLNDGSAPPTYYWTDGSGTNLGTSLSSTLGFGTKQTNTHKICFVNAGETQVTSNIKFNIHAVQKNP